MQPNSIGTHNSFSLEKFWRNPLIKLLNRKIENVRHKTRLIIIIIIIIINWYENVPKFVETSKGGKVTILWNQQMQTDRTISNTKPDIIICDNEKRTCMLIDVAISGDRKVIKKIRENSKI
jgi:hypothetical protein